MRGYAKISPQLWIGDTGRKLRDAGQEAMLVALYLLSNPHANMLGLYYLPTLFIAHETGLGSEGASKGLRRAIEAGFCTYDESSEMVFIPEMARYQIDDQLVPTDKRCAGIQREYDGLPNNPFLATFYEKYAKAFHLKTGRDNGRPSEGAPMPLRSQEQEQEHDQDINTLPQTAFADAHASLSDGTKNSKPTEVQIEQLYDLYPRKRDKLDAKKAIRKAVAVVMHGDPEHTAMPLDDALDYLAQRVTLYAKCVQGSGFIPYPATWFNAGSFWDDERDWSKLQRESKTHLAPAQGLPADYVPASEEIKRERNVVAWTRSATAAVPQ
jgi:hypothetical protein